MKRFIVYFAVFFITIGILASCEKGKQSEATKPFPAPQVIANANAQQEEGGAGGQEESQPQEQEPEQKPEPPKITNIYNLGGAGTVYEACFFGVYYYITDKGSITPALAPNGMGSVYVCEDK